LYGLESLLANWDAKVAVGLGSGRWDAI
jgi:hypothetical protein